MIQSKWHKKVATLADAMDLDADQYDIMVQWFDNNFVQLGQNTSMDMELHSRSYSDSNALRNYLKDGVGGSFGREIVNSDLVHKSVVEADGFETTRYGIIVFKGVNNG